MSELSISEHARQRYAERIMKREDKVSVSAFVALHQEKIQKDLNKMVEYGEKVYSGKTMKDASRETEVYVKDFWILLVDKKKQSIITLYRVDLGDDELDRLYMERCLSRIREAKGASELEKSVADTKIRELKELISDNETLISITQEKLKDLKDRNETMNAQIRDLKRGAEEADLSVMEAVAKLLNRPVF